jgi:hypothetical protein
VKNPISPYTHQTDIQVIGNLSSSKKFWEV